MGFKLDLADLAMKSLLKFSIKSLMNLSLCDQLMGLMGFNGIISISKFCLLMLFLLNVISKKEC